jgi:endonuclease-3 related protein
LSGRLREVYDRLLAAYAPQHWWPGDSPFEVIVGAILTQSAAWTNVEKALSALKNAGALTPEGMDRLDEAELARLVRPAGYFNAKARKLKAFLATLRDAYGGDLDSMLAAPAEALRERLLATHGIGPETADSVLLYAAERPAFVIDAYARRLFSRLGVRPGRDAYDRWQALFLEALEPDAALFNEYHALIVRHGKERCRREPMCEGCPLLPLCPHGRSRVGDGAAVQRSGE